MQSRFFMIGNQRKLTVDLDNKTEKINKQLEELYKLKCSSFHKRDMDLKTYNRSKTFIQKKQKQKKDIAGKLAKTEIIITLCQAIQDEYNSGDTCDDIDGEADVEDSEEASTEEKSSSDDSSSEEESSEKDGNDDTPNNGAPVYVTNGDGAPVDNTPIHVTPVDIINGDGAPVDNTPVHVTAVDIIYR